MSSEVLSVNSVTKLYVFHLTLSNFSVCWSEFSDLEKNLIGHEIAQSLESFKNTDDYQTAYKTLAAYPEIEERVTTHLE